MTEAIPRLAARAVIVKDDRLLLVNAFSSEKSDLWCAPGGGAMAGHSLSDNLVREVWEETGLTVAVGPLIGVHEFHNPDDGFHQVDLFFRATIMEGQLDDDWRDPEAVVTDRRFFSRAQLAGIRMKPDILVDLAFTPCAGLNCGPLERMVTS